MISNHAFNPQNINKLNVFQNQPQKTSNNNITNNYIKYNNNQSQSERLTIFYVHIQTSQNIHKKKDINVTYNDFDSSGYVKNYRTGIPHREKFIRWTKIKSRYLVSKTNINNI